ncbi:MAG: hypothetical protein JWO59_2020, partial [Chloroflexi bacterium]|nr:hypothetical protein [Chloroflexota bacterium]
MTVSGNLSDTPVPRPRSQRGMDGIASPRWVPLAMRFVNDLRRAARSLRTVRSAIDLLSSPDAASTKASSKSLFLVDPCSCHACHYNRVARLPRPRFEGPGARQGQLLFRLAGSLRCFIAGYRH